MLSEEQGKNGDKVPILQGRTLDIYMLYLSVVHKGGFRSVTAAKLWRSIAEEFKLEMTNMTGRKLKETYDKWLLKFEKNDILNIYE